MLIFAGKVEADTPLSGEARSPAESSSSESAVGTLALPIDQSADEGNNAQ